MAVPSSILTKSVCNAMKRIAPIALTGSWDNVGSILESPVPADHRPHTGTGSLQRGSLPRWTDARLVPPSRLSRPQKPLPLP
ncbi:hypothetical protein C8F01DRAFT_1143366 [Mycena amicta]|nr:hypothetical protein C8F01DRAFT_1143366 [Mycena amicta]